jgi:hypothetical protein
MRWLTGAVAGLLLFTACSSAAAPSPSTAAPTATPSAQTTREMTSPTPSSAAAATGAPRPLEEVPVVMGAGAFPITASFALTPGKIDADLDGVVRLAITRYLDGLDRFRATGAQRSQLHVSGKFGDAVFAGMKASADGVQRAFALDAFRVDNFFVKPWGTRATAEVTATIVDKAVDGSGSDQVETGRLRLVGDKLDVVDGWDTANGRWFNGPTALSADALRDAVAWPISNLLGGERWDADHPLQLNSGGVGPTPYQKARQRYLASLDPTKNVTRAFVDVAATIERYETFAEIRDGLATVRIAGTAVTTDTSGNATRTPFTRRAMVFFGNWIPEVVDEQISANTWLSGGDLALAARDQNFA